jgi:hypothetical protein
MKDLVACFQFSSGNLHLASSIEVSEIAGGHLENLDYFWWGGRTKYPSIMARQLDTFLSGSSPKIIKVLLGASRFKNVSLNPRVKLPKHYFEPARDALLLQLSNCQDLDSLYMLDFGGITPGPAISNALAFETQGKIDKIDAHRATLNKLLISYLEIYFLASEHIKKEDYKSVIVYNGRFLHERAVWDACKNLGQDVILYETVRDRFHYRHNQGFHNHFVNQQVMIDHWNNSELSLEKKVEIGSRYFEDLSSAKNAFYNPPSGPVVSKRKNIVFFSNSDDEYVGFRENGVLPDQLETIFQIAKHLNCLNDYDFIVRLHPNLKNKSLSEQERWGALSGISTIRIFDQFSLQDSYELMRNASGVISFGSTIGLEASFWEIPSLVFGESSYGRLGAVDTVTNMGEFFSWVDTLPLVKQQLKVRKQNACIRGFWLETGGSKIENSKLLESGWGAWEVSEFRGVSLKPRRLSRDIHLVQNLIKRKWRGFHRK